MKTQKLLAIAAMVLMTACTATDSQQGECRIHGTLSSDKWDGQYIFLVPTYRADSVGVDSAKIAGRKFEFVTTKRNVSDLRLSWRTRFGTQNLLVVTEPGDVYVTIDSISHGYGTPQNDSLQAWKTRTENFKRKARALSAASRNFYAAQDSVSGDAIKEQLIAARNEYRKATLRMAKQMEGTPLSEFMYRIYPER